MMHPMGGEGQLIWMFVMGIIVVVPFWRICMKAGYTCWLALLIFVPLANLGLLYFLAFANWPSLRNSNVES